MEEVNLLVVFGAVALGWFLSSFTDLLKYIADNLVHIFIARQHKWQRRKRIAIQLEMIKMFISDIVDASNITENDQIDKYFTNVQSKSRIARDSVDLGLIKNLVKEEWACPLLKKPIYYYKMQLLLTGLDRWNESLEVISNSSQGDSLEEYTELQEEMLKIVENYMDNNK